MRSERCRCWPSSILEPSKPLFCPQRTSAESWSIQILDPGILLPRVRHVCRLGASARARVLHSTSPSYRIAGILKTQSSRRGRYSKSHESCVPQHHLQAVPIIQKPASNGHTPSTPSLILSRTFPTHCILQAQPSHIPPLLFTEIQISVSKARDTTQAWPGCRCRKPPQQNLGRREGSQAACPASELCRSATF